MGMIVNAKKTDLADRHLFEYGVGQIPHQMLCVFTDINVFCMAYILKHSTVSIIWAVSPN